MRLKIFATGGTFDKVYNASNGELVFKETHVPTMLAESYSKISIEVEQLLLIDSLHIKDHHREEILNACKACNEDRIIITHGTDTMVETAKLLGTGIHDKIIVLTGSMIPYSFVKSDALFNLGCAIAFAQLLPKGVYISMHGKVFDYRNVRKNKETLEFEKIV